MRLFFLFVLTLLTFGLKSQSDDVFYILQSKSNGSLTINQPVEVEQKVKTHIDINKKMLGIKGYRIQIGLFSGKKAREKAYSLKSRYLSSNEDKTDIYVSYSAPYFNVRIGNFFTKSEALKELIEIKEKFPGAFIVEEFITIEDE